MKPHREFFDTVTTSLGVAPDSILFIDDQSHVVEAARRFGWKTIQFETPTKLRAELRRIDHAVL
jgi:HAD superfamily hydrolase (TIGR01509 family)